MAKSKEKSKDKKKTTSLRQSIDESSKKPHKKRRLRKGASSVKNPVKKFASKGRKEFRLPVPGNNPEKFLGKKRSLTPSYFKNSWSELRNVTWPDRQTTFKLTVAVLLFAIIFGVAIALVDYGLDKIFKKLILE